MDNFSRYGRLIAGVCFLLVSGIASAQSMPSVTPISSVPQGPAPGGGVVSSVTYEIRGGSAAAGAAANEASFVTRAVTVAGPTMGGILRGATALGARAIPWVAAALTAYEAYKWYTDSSGVLMVPASVTPGATCVAGGAYFQIANFSGCSVPGVVSKYKDFMTGYWSYMPPTWITFDGCVPSSPGNSCQFTFVYHDGRSAPGETGTATAGVSWVKSGSPVTQDPDINNPSSPVTNEQLAQLVQDNPQWWPDMLQDPQTGQPLLTPEIADDIDNLKHQIAPRYGVDPETLPQTQPDPDYVNGKAEPRETSLPAYCAWAADACAYHQWVKDHWPDNEDKKKYQDNGCDVPPECTGDTILCAEVLNTWKLKCAFSTDDAPPDTPDLQPGDVSNPEQDLGDTSSLDRSGLGWGVSCPFSDIVVPMPGDATVTLTFEPVCEYGPYMRIFILIMAGITCAGILGGFSLHGVTGGG